jgi:hypothetical protein
MVKHCNAMAELCLARQSKGDAMNETQPLTNEQIWGVPEEQMPEPEVKDYFDLEDDEDFEEEKDFEEEEVYQEDIEDAEYE